MVRFQPRSQALDRTQTPASTPARAATRRSRAPTSPEPVPTGSVQHHLHIRTDMLAGHTHVLAHHKRIDRRCRRGHRVSAAWINHPIQIGPVAPRPPDCLGPFAEPLQPPIARARVVHEFGSEPSLLDCDCHSVRRCSLRCLRTALSSGEQPHLRLAALVNNPGQR